MGIVAVCPMRLRAREGLKNINDCSTGPAKLVIRSLIEQKSYLSVLHCHHANELLNSIHKL